MAAAAVAGPAGESAVAPRVGQLVVAPSGQGMLVYAAAPSKNYECSICLEAAMD